MTVVVDAVVVVVTVAVVTVVLVAVVVGTHTSHKTGQLVIMNALTA